jgi:hypothetical protein
LLIRLHNPKNQIASFLAFKPKKLAISNLAPLQKSTPVQWLGRFFTADYVGAITATRAPAFDIAYQATSSAPVRVFPQPRPANISQVAQAPSGVSCA